MFFNTEAIPVKPLQSAEGCWLQQSVYPLLVSCGQFQGNSLFTGLEKSLQNYL